MKKEILELYSELTDRKKYTQENIEKVVKKWAKRKIHTREEFGEY